MAATKVKVGDTVVVHTGKDKGLRGKVLRVIRDADRVIVEGVNRVHRHQKAGTGAGGSNTAGGIITKEAALHISNVRVVESGDAKADKKAAKADKKAAKAEAKADKKAAKAETKADKKSPAAEDEATEQDDDTKDDDGGAPSDEATEVSQDDSAATGQSDDEADQADDKKDAS